MSALKLIMAARRASSKAEERYHEVLREQLQPGTRVYLGRYGSGRVCTVLETAGPKVKVRSTHNEQREYWVDAQFIETIYTSQIENAGVHGFAAPQQQGEP